MSIGNEVRLKHAYYVKCNSIKKDKNGEIIEIKCSYDPTTKGGWSDDGRKIKGTIHWVSANHSINIEIRIYDRLFNSENPEQVKNVDNDFSSNINYKSLQILKNCQAEASLLHAKRGNHYQFIRTGYFILEKNSNNKTQIFNRTITLRDSFNK